MSTRTMTKTSDTPGAWFHNLNATRIIVTTIGVIFGLSGMNHGFFEFLQGNVATNGLVIHAIGPENRFWVQGTEDAFTIIPNYMVSGLLAMLIGLLIIIWSLWFIQTRYGRTIFLLLFIALFLVGGGIGQIAFFIPAWAFATRMNKPLIWWRKALPERIRPFFSTLWPITLLISTVFILVGIEIAIFGYFPSVSDPNTLQNMAMSFVLTSAILNIITFVAGLGHDILRLSDIKPNETGGFS